MSVGGFAHRGCFIGKDCTIGSAVFVGINRRIICHFLYATAGSFFAEFTHALGEMTVSKKKLGLE